MKKIGIIFALNDELKETKKIFNSVKKHYIYNLTIFECSNNKVICFLVESGMGKVNAARCTQILIDKMNVDYILNIGVAGSVLKEINKCDIVIADKLVQHDYDARPLGFKRAEIPNIGIYIDCDKKLLDIAKKVDIDTKIIVGVVASGDIFVTEKEMGVKINKKYNALCVEMEGAAIAQVCHLCRIPYLVIRSISDSPYEENNNITFEEFLTISANMAAKFIEQFLKRIE